MQAFDMRHRDDLAIVACDHDRDVLVTQRFEQRQRLAARVAVEIRRRSSRTASRGLSTLARASATPLLLAARQLVRQHTAQMADARPDDGLSHQRSDGASARRAFSARTRCCARWWY